MLASCALDVKFHDWEASECLGTVHAPDPKHKGFIDIAWCNQGKNIVCVPIQGKCINVSIYNNVRNSSEKFKPTKENIDVVGARCASFSRIEAPNVVLGTYTGEIILYNTNHGKLLQTFSELPAAINFIQHGAQDLFIAAGCGNGQIYIFGPNREVNAAYFIPDSDSLTSVCVHSRVPYLLAGGSEQGIVAIWDINSGNNVLKSTNHFGSVLDMSFSITDDLFTTIGDDKKINIYDLRTSECVHEKKFDTDLTALAYCPNGTDIAVGTGRGQIICLDKRYLHSHKNGLKAHKCPVKKILFDNSNYIQKPIHHSYSKSTVGDDILEDDIIPSSIGSSICKIPGDSGDFKTSKNKFRYQTLDKCSLATSHCHIGPQIDRTTFHIIDEHSLLQLREEVMRSTKEVVHELTEKMNNEFLKIRMGVSREFCTMEISNKRRWQEFNMILLKIADLDDSDLPTAASFKEDVSVGSKCKISSSSQCLNRKSNKSFK